MSLLRSQSATRHLTVEEALMHVGAEQESARLAGRSFVTKEYQQGYREAMDWAYASGLSDTSISFFLEKGREHVRQHKQGAMSWMV
jgi:hypothetical protein